MKDPNRNLASPSAARLTGDDYQHIFTLMQAVRLLREDVWGVTGIRMEAGEAGNVDDLVVEYRDLPTLYHQVKFSRVAGEPLEHSWFTDPDGRRQSPLQRFRESFLALTEGKTRPRMALITNRAVAPGDPILSNLEGLDGRLVPRLATAAPAGASGKARASWAKHLGISEEELLEMLDHLEIHASMGTLEILRDRCSETMLAAGLRGDVEAVTLGHSAIRELIEQGHENLDAEAMRQLVERLRLAVDKATGALEVAAIDRSPYPEAASVALDWVDRYEGEEPRARRRLLDADSSVPAMRDDLGLARARLAAAGYSQVRVAGAFRLDVAFAVGAELADTAGFQLSIRQRSELWSSDGDATPFELAIEPVDIGQGSDLGVCLSISNEVGLEVADYIESNDLPVGRLVSLSPIAGSARDAVKDAAQARGCTRAALTALRAEAHGAEAIHLFLSTPAGLALLIGHAWNRLPETRVYADLSPGYEPTFRISG